MLLLSCLHTHLDLLDRRCYAATATLVLTHCLQDKREERDGALGKEVEEEGGGNAIKASKAHLLFVVAAATAAMEKEE